MAKNHAPISSFGTELHAVLRQGADRHVRITFATRNLAIRFKQRVNQLRNAMKHEGHKDWQHLYRCGVYEDPSDPRIVTIGPKDSEFRSALLAAGLTEIPPTAPVTEVSVGSPEPGSVDEFLSTLTDATSVQ